MKKLNKKKLVIIIVVVLLIIASVVTIILLFNKKDNSNNDVKDNVVTDNKKEEKKKITVVDPDSDERPFAVMINNHPSAREHHAGLQDAYIIYEITVEGGMTRYLAVFKGTDTKKIGSVRSARHYFLDYAMENDAVYVHWGWSPQAEFQIGTLGINNLNGLAYEGVYFYRDKSLNVSSEHTGFTTMEMLRAGAEKRKYRTTSDKDLLLNYTTDTVDLSKKDGAQKAEKVVVNYSNSVTDSYTYDSANSYYLRSVNGKEHIDDVTKEQYHFKNIIVYQAENFTIVGDDKGRQDLKNLGSGEGYYITNGYAVKIKWSKDERENQTKYTYLDGKEIDVSDGNTFIQIQPIGAGVNIS